MDEEQVQNSRQGKTVQKVSTGASGESGLVLSLETGNKMTG